MIFQCFSWIVHLLKQIKQNNDGDEDDAPLLEVPDFGKKLISSSNSASERPLLLRYYGHDYPRFSIINGKWENTFNYVRGLSNNCRFVSCCDKLILLEDDPTPHRRYIINSLSMWSSVTVIDLPDWGMSSGYVCGFFFHPKAREYMILCTWPLANKNYNYQLYLCGSRIWRRVANPTLGYGPNGKMGKFIDGIPAIVNGCLHWFIGKIMVFDIFTEEFCLKLAPFEECYHNRNFYVQDLLVKDDCLCFCRGHFQKLEIEIWILEDYKQWSWNKKYVVNLSGIYKFPFDKPIINPLVNVVSIHKDEFVLFWVHRGLFSCNLEFNTVEKIPIKKVPMKYSSLCNYIQNITYFGIVAYN